MKMCSLFLILGQLFLFGCGVLHKTTKKNSVATLKDREEIQVKDQSKYLHQQEAKSLTIQTDSLDSFSQIEIWPKGKFDFSPAQGFSGQAEKVLIYKRTKSENRSIEKKQEVMQRTNVVDRAESRVKARDVSRKDTEKKSFKLSVWHWILIPIGLLFLWCISKFKSFIHS